ncbi:hypothetical protein SO802_007063 [Lithocarpus litseifolius]|uniref:Uncharacterized protein n=1 Tax=Lithocarpus litseifolius TaxID=425828 RepID=A0AAW2DML2_9ROSI
MAPLGTASSAETLLTSLLGTIPIHWLDFAVAVVWTKQKYEGNSLADCRSPLRRDQIVVDDIYPITGETNGRPDAPTPCVGSSTSEDELLVVNTTSPP